MMVLGGNSHNGKTQLETVNENLNAQGPKLQCPLRVKEDKY